MRYFFFTSILIGILCTNCAVSQKDYAEFYQNPENGFRHSLQGKGHTFIIQYFSSTLKVLSEGEEQSSESFKARKKELDRFVVFELEVSKATDELKTYLKSSAETDIILSTGKEQRFPVFYHKESNPMSVTERVLIFFQRKPSDVDYQLTINESKWFAHTVIEIEKQNIEKSPQLNI